MTGQTSRWFPNEPKMWLHSSQTYLLLQDFNLHVLPHRDDGDVYKLSTQGVSSSLVNKSLSLWDRGHGSDSFVSAVASTLLTEHEAWLEVILNPDRRDGLPFRAMLVPGAKRTSTGRLIQKAPVLESPKYPYQGQPRRRFEEIELDGERMIHVLLPDKYPSRLLKKIVEDLVEVDLNENLMPSWVKEQMVGQRKNAPAFQPSEAARTERLRILQATLPIGWTAREIYYGATPNLGDYYYYWRELRFLHFRSSMRGRAEEALRQVLTVAGEKCGFEAHITVRGLYTPNEVEEIIERYKSGDIPFSALTNIIFESTNSGESGERYIL